jgi:hypothetical protein
VNRKAVIIGLVLVLALGATVKRRGTGTKVKKVTGTDMRGMPGMARRVMSR